MIKAARDRLLGWLGFERAIRVLLTMRGGGRTSFTCSEINFKANETQLVDLNAERARGVADFIALPDVVILDTEWCYRRAGD